MCVWNSRDGGKHHSLLSPGTGDFTRFHLHKKWMPHASPNWGGGGGWEFQMTSALILLVTLLLFWTIHDPYFPKERLFPSAVSTLMQMFHKSEIVLVKKKNAKSFTL